MSLESKVDTEEFNNRSLFSKLIGYAGEKTILPQFPEPLRSDTKQFNEAKRNLEIAVEGLARLTVRHPVKTASVMYLLKDWATKYFTEQKKPIPRYLVFTDKDKDIDFRPEEDTWYIYMLAQITTVTNEVADHTTLKEFMTMVRAFKDVNGIGTEAFIRCPSVMPRYTDHKRQGLYVVQKLDQPYNCCPSLHIAYSLSLDNIAMKHAKDEEVKHDLRKSTKRMFNSVLYVRQHAILDVAFGMMCARMVYEKHYGEDFNDFRREFGNLQKDNPTIPYDEIEKIYEEITDIRATIIDRFDLAIILDRYIDRHGYKLSDSVVTGSYFDTGTKRITETL